MKILKWIAITFATLLVLLIAFALLVPVLFGDRIKEEVTKQIDTYVDADVAFGDVDLSVLRDFPKLSLGIEDIMVDGRGVFDTIQLAKLDRLDVSVDFWSAVGEGPIQIRSVSLDHPRLHVLTLADGRTNTDIIRNINEAAAADPSAGGSTEISLEEYGITEGEVIYDDRAAELFVHITGLNHQGSGDFTATHFALDTDTQIADLDMVSAGIAYLRNATVDYDAELAIDTEAGTITLADNALKLNELLLEASGVVGMPTQDGRIAVDVDFNSPEQDFRALWSVVPAVVTQDLSGLKTAGDFSIRGSVDGAYVPEPQSLPGFAIDLVVNDASVQYPDLPKALTAINVKAGIRSAGRDLADLLVDVERFSFNLGANPFSGRLRVKQGTTDPAFDLVAKGNLDLGDLADAVPLEGVETLAGRIALDIEAQGTASGAQSDLRSISSRGLAEFSNVVYDATEMPRVEIRTGTARFDGQEVKVENMAIQAGKSDLAVDGTLRDPFALATETGTLGGSMNIRSNFFDANEWIEPTSTTPGATTGEVEPPARPFDRFDIAFDATINKMEYDIYTLTDTKASGSVTSETLELKNASFSTANSDVALSGTLDNLYGFSFDNEELTGNLQLKSSQLDLLALSEVGIDPNAPVATTSAEEVPYIALPENMSIRVAAAVDKLLYDDIAVSNVSGVIAMANQGAVIENGSGKVIGGTMKIDGGYQYLGENTPPTFDLKYDIQNASFRQAFEQLNTVQQLAPIAKYLDGSFNTNLVMSSTLGRDMLPNLQQLDADGFIATLNATIASLPALQKASRLLGLSALERIDLKNTKNWFTVEDGTVTVRPFEVNWSGIDATIGGTHGLDQSMNYEIVALVPRELLGKNTVGAAANTGLDFLSGQASKLGLNLNVGEFVRVRIGLTGSIDDPKVDLKLLGTEGEGTLQDGATAAIKDLAQQARDSIERVAQARLNDAKAQAEARARAVADSVRTAAENRARAAADEARAKAQAEANRLAQKAADEARARAAEEAKRLADEAAKKASQDAKDKAKDALNDIFGKKKPD